MKNEALDSDAMVDVFKSGYTRGQIVKAIILALVLHVVLLGAYVIIGSGEHKKPVAKKEEPKPDAKAAETGDAPKDASKDASKSDPTRPAPAPTSNGDAKKTEVAKPGEVPAAPDSDIDAILKSK